MHNPLPKASFRAISDFLNQEVDHGNIPGAVFLLTKQGDTLYHCAFGQQDTARGLAMHPDTLFRVKSMTKLVTSIAVLSAIEEGRLNLLDPLPAFIPAFKNPDVLVDPNHNDRIRARRDITIYDLITHTSGLCYGQGGRHIAQEYRDAGLTFDIFFRTPLSTKDVVDRLSTLPLLFQPGSSWAYSWGCDVLGHVLEIVDDAPLEEVFHKRVFAPLQLTDIGFSFDKDKATRMAQPRTEDRPLYFGNDGSVNDAPFFSGGEGLIASASDWSRLVNNLMGYGSIPPLLSEPMLRYMLSDHVGSWADLPGFPLQRAYSYAMGVYIRQHAGMATSPANIGEFGWWGSWGTAFWGDPKAGVVGVLMMQRSEESRYYSETVKLQSYVALDRIGRERGGSR